MKTSIYSILDTKTKTYNPPFYQKNAEEASRTFSKIAKDSQSLIGQYPEDFVLCQIGVFDDESGSIEPHQIITVATASQYATK